MKSDLQFDFVSLLNILLKWDQKNPLKQTFLPSTPFYQVRNLERAFSIPPHSSSPSCRLNLSQTLNESALFYLHSNFFRAALSLSTSIFHFWDFSRRRIWLFVMVDRRLRVQSFFLLESPSILRGKRVFGLSSINWASGFTKLFVFLPDLGLGTLD